MSPHRSRSYRRTSYLTEGKEAAGCIIVLLSFIGYLSDKVGKVWTGLPLGWQIIIVVGIFLLVIAVIWRAIVRRNQRKEAWQRAMANWQQGAYQGNPDNVKSVLTLSPSGLEKFSAELFSKMGYRVKHTGQSGDHGVDVHLINPANESELVQCKQWNKPVGEPEVRDLAGAMSHEGAVRGFIMAPGGFTETARRWAQGKPIVLADQREIDRLVVSAYGQGTKTFKI